MSYQHAGVAELADARDLKSRGTFLPYRFDSGLRHQTRFAGLAIQKQLYIAGWSSLVARRAHNPKVVGSNPAPATTLRQTVWFVVFLPGYETGERSSLG